jgi:peptidyl-tRNA hydrolase
MSEQKQDDPLVIYIVIRRDLLTELKWPLGSLISQGAHASTAAISLFYEHEHTKKYLQDLDNMRKVALEIPNEKELIALHEKLNEKGIDHKLWVEQPENIRTALATRPYPRSEIRNLFKVLKLFK